MLRIVLKGVSGQIVLWLILTGLLISGLMTERVHAQGLNRIGLESVWKTNEQSYREWSDCITQDKYQGKDKLACFINVMRKYGALPQAIEFSKLLFQKDEYGYMTRFWKKGRVDLANIFFFRANTNDVLYMVNGSPVLVSTEDHLRNINIKKHPLYSKLVKKYPKLELWQCSGFKEMKELTGGGQRFIFSYFLKNGCNACEVGGFAFIAYDFDQNGVFKETNLLSITDEVPLELKR